MAQDTGQEPAGGLTPRLAQIVAMFAEAEGRDKLELLIDYSQSLPAVPAELRDNHAGMEEVHECATPVFVRVENHDGKLRYTFDIPPSAPTVRGLAAILGIGLQDASPEQVLQLPADVYMRMGLHKVLTPQRLRGSAGLIARLKRLAVRELAGAEAPAAS